LIFPSVMAPPPAESASPHLRPRHGQQSVTGQGRGIHRYQQA
jgi:hypothetical protein